MPLRGQRGDANGSVGGRRAFEGARDLHETVALEPNERRMRAAGAMCGAWRGTTLRARFRCRGHQRVDPEDLATLEHIEDLPADPTLGEASCLPRLRDLHVALALDPRARRHRSRHRFAGAARIVVGDPRSQSHDVRGQKWDVVQYVNDRLDRVGVRGLRLDSP